MNHEKHEKKSEGLVPKLRFPEFRDSGEWGHRELGEFVTERNQFPKEKESVPLFSLTIEDGITSKTERYERSFLVNDEVDAYKLVLPDDFAYNPMNLRFGAIGRHSGTENVAVSKYYNIFFCDKTVDSKFCEIYFKSDRMIAFYDNMAIGSLIEKRRVHFSEFLKFNIRFPLLPEQQRIADCLTSLDELISAEAGKLEAYKAHKKGLMQKLFPAEGETVPEWRFPEFRGTGEWEVKTLGQIGELKNGANFSTEKKGTGILTVDVLNMYNTGIEINLNSLYRVDVEANEYFLNNGDILFVRSSMKREGVGWASIFFGYTEPVIYCGFLIRLRLTSFDLYNPKYLLYYLRSEYGRNDIVSLSGTAAITNISQNSLNSVCIPIPKIKEQQRIADCLTSLDELISAQSQKIDALKAHKKGLMQGLFPSVDEVGV